MVFGVDFPIVSFSTLKYFVDITYHIATRSLYISRLQQEAYESLGHRSCLRKVVGSLESTARCIDGITMGGHM